MVKRIWRALAIGMVILLGQTACFDSPRLFESMKDLQESVRSDRTKLTFIYAGGDSIGNMAMSELVKGFNQAQEQYEIIEISPPPGSPTYDEYLKNMAAMGELSDMVEVRNPQLFAEKGVIQPLSDDLVSLLKSPAFVNGEVYAAPLGGRQPLGIIYNKDIFEAAGIQELPNNWEQFLDLCERLKQQGYTPLVMAGKDLWNLGFWQSFFMGSYVYSYNDNWNVLRKQGKVSFTDNNMLKAMNDMTELWTKGYINTNWLSVADSDIPAYMTGGRVAMVYHGTWMANAIKQYKSDFPLGVFLLKDRQARTIILDENTPEGLNMTSEASADPLKKEVFEAFIRYLYSKEVFTEYLRTTRNLDITKQGIVYEEMNQFPSPAHGEQNVIKVRYMHEYWGEGAVTSEFRDWLWRLMQNWLEKGTPSINEAMRQADAMFDLYHLDMNK